MSSRSTPSEGSSIDTDRPFASAGLDWLERRFAELEYGLSNMAAQACEPSAEELREYGAIGRELRRRRAPT